MARPDINQGIVVDCLHFIFIFLIFNVALITFELYSPHLRKNCFRQLYLNQMLSLMNLGRLGLEEGIGR